MADPKTGVSTALTNLNELEVGGMSVDPVNQEGEYGIDRRHVEDADSMDRGMVVSIWLAAVEKMQDSHLSLLLSVCVVPIEETGS